LPDAIIAADPKFSAAQADSNQILWLALTLTPGLGPTRSRRLVEFFGTVDRVFSASLTELEASGLPVQSAQALATGAGQLNLLMKKWRAPRRRTYTCWLLTIPHIPLDCGRSTILPWCSTVEDVWENCRRMCDLPSPRRPALNRKLVKLHLYSRNLRSLRTKKDLFRAQGR